ncbi:MAG: hypothetical protein ABJB97_11500, partial [Acidobacteriota bacterium]
MNRLQARAGWIIFTVTTLVAVCFLLTGIPGQAQTSPNPTQAQAQHPATPDNRPAQVLYEDANGYLGRRYAEFNKQKLSYDPKLEAKTKQEQKDLALRNAATLATRSKLSDEDIYYLGLLYHLTGDADAALEQMRRYLAHNSSGEKPQIARAVVVLYATKKNLNSEAETVVADYREEAPEDLDELYGMEALLTDAFNRAKDYERMATHAKGMAEVTHRSVQLKQLSSIKRDERLFRSASLLAEALSKMNKQAAAIASIEDLMKLAISLPSGNL